MKWFRDPFYKITMNGPCLNDSRIAMGAYHDTKTNQWWLSCIDVARVLERDLGASYFQQKMKLSSLDTRKQPITHVWQDSSWVGRIKAVEYCVKTTELKPLILWLLKRCRQTAERQRKNALKLGVWLNEEDVKEPIEQHLVDVLQRVCPYELKLQFQLGKYRLDIFVPEWKMVIQIDEHGHKRSGYSAQEEQDMDDYLHHLGFSLLRFNPHAPLGSTDDTVEDAFVKQVWATSVKKPVGAREITIHSNNVLIPAE